MTKIIPPKLDFEKMNGLIPAIIQHAYNGKVLMLGWMNEEALKITCETNQAIFWSRSKNRLWKKGEESGNSLEVVSLETDCDSDTILIRALPNGPTCHTGNTSCFDNQISFPLQGKSLSSSSSGMASEQSETDEKVQLSFEELFARIQQRKRELPEGSYTTSLFEKGLQTILSKIAEESLEVMNAAKRETEQRLVEETCDLLFHTFVLLVEKGIELPGIFEELAKRKK